MKDTQCDRILRYMQERGSITPVDAMREFGCMRLAARIGDLRKAGHDIKDQWASSENRWGETVRFKAYGLKPPTPRYTGDWDQLREEARNA